MAERGDRVRSARALPALPRPARPRGAAAGALRRVALRRGPRRHHRHGLHHKLCHVLGGSFGLPHAETHAVILPHAAAYNAAAAGDLLAPVAAALGGGAAAAALFGLARRIGAPRSLRELGLAEADLDRAADLAVENPYWNPRPVEPDGDPGASRPRAWAGRAAGRMSLAGREVAVIGGGIGGLAAATGAGAARGAGSPSSSRRRR